MKIHHFVFKRSILVLKWGPPKKSVNNMHRNCMVLGAQSRHISLKNDEKITEIIKFTKNKKFGPSQILFWYTKSNTDPLECVTVPEITRTNCWHFLWRFPFLTAQLTRIPGPEHKMMDFHEISSEYPGFYQKIANFNRSYLRRYLSVCKVLGTYRG